ncbi:hypothetical protein ElyMa_005636100 [Elysia marginata]|uniref:Uncharacterized protein n=1 Tax=Elysia marginata TaxID=1093978 RepID=A0AAV4FB85_9GAST|nr:hypothetical protein ElyMa_005636100 [Elysia marginata]
MQIQSSKIAVSADFLISEMKYIHSCLFCALIIRVSIRVWCLRVSSSSSGAVPGAGIDGHGFPNLSLTRGPHELASCMLLQVCPGV